MPLGAYRARILSTCRRACRLEATTAYSTSQSTPYEIIIWTGLHLGRTVSVASEEVWASFMLTPGIARQPKPMSALAALGVLTGPDGSIGVGPKEAETSVSSCASGACLLLVVIGTTNPAVSMLAQ